jgi:hypothetical protein
VPLAGPPLLELDPQVRLNGIGGTPRYRAVGAGVEVRKRFKDRKFFAECGGVHGAPQ